MGARNTRATSGISVSKTHPPWWPNVICNGRTHYPLCDPTKVTHLELNNLQDFGQLYEGKDMPSVPNRCTPIDRRPETKYLNGDSKLKYPRPMRDHFRRITSRCTLP
ncbi:hypothetical protein ABVK25_002236 [Lepraria finkii]|uniref:Uncharacterized protein n=1 Tax=Lepraria finkii TaxID=1340010 RepID=A0ABR4BHV3_9LECA